MKSANYHEGTIRKCTGNGKVIRLVMLNFAPQEWVNKFDNGRQGFGIYEADEVDDQEYIVRSKEKPSKAKTQREEMCKKMKKSEKFNDFIQADERYIALCKSVCGITVERWNGFNN